MRLVDTHCHLDAAEFDADRDVVVERARAAGVERQVIPAVGAAGWPGLRGLCARHQGLHPAYGLHPVFLGDDAWQAMEALPGWLERERPCAIGECGLDHYVEGLDRERQHAVFVRHVELARDTGLPLVVHALRAVEEVILVLRRFPGVRGVVHSYSGSAEQARQLFDMGFLLGIGGPVTYDRARRLRALVAAMPLEQLLLETDAPDQPDSLRRGERNEPCHLPTVLATIAELRDEDPAALAAATSANAERLFGLADAIRSGSER